MPMQHLTPSAPAMLMSIGATETSERQQQLLQEMKSSLRTVRSQLHHVKFNEGAEPGQTQLLSSLF